MKADHKELIGQAIGALKLRDIMLHESSFKRPAPPPATTNIEATQQAKRQVKFIVGSAPGNDDTPAKLLQVFVELGLRVTSMDETDPDVYFEIEADFMVEYDIKCDVSQDAIKLFADLNSVHNVWPFWRQHVFDIVSRARLPQLEVPLFSVTPSAASRDEGATD
jgi:preprotein translocase subunit SecB